MYRYPKWVKILTCIIRKGSFYEKKLLIVVSIISILLISLVVFAVIKTLLNDGYAFYGDVWEDTPEKALQKAAEQDSETMQTLTSQIIFEKTTLDDIVLMTFLSKNDTLVTVTFVTNEKEQYSVSGWTVEYDLAHPSEFLIDGNPNQFILFPYQKHGNIVLGWCYSTARFTVNGVYPERKTFSFDIQGTTYSIDFWNIEILDDSVSMEYLPG